MRLARETPFRYMTLSSGARLVLLFAATASAAKAADERVVLPRDAAATHYDIALTPDAEHLAFKGTVAIQLEVARATRSIVLNSKGLVIDSAALRGVPSPAAVTYDAAQETATLTFPAELKPGRRTLQIAYRGKINQQEFGMFALDYQSGGGTRRALFTQFENADARNFVPCWDEPALKATFTLSADVPRGQMALSNMPVESDEPLPGGRRRVRFAETPRMSTYLLFFALGDFERIHRVVDGVDIGVVVKRGSTEAAGYALETACRILPYYNDYFGTRYPLPKLDLIAGPGNSHFGAMENWGAIFYQENSLLFDARISGQGTKQWVHTTIAHEMAHQWFGDLVTMAWWDDVWLNEGFASWMEVKATDRLNPDWNSWLDDISDRNAVMQVDARDGTHPVVTPIHDVLQIWDAFDDITYKKGEAVIRMLEAYVGEDAFRAGVRTYMRDHAYHNTSTEDFWRELNPAAAGDLADAEHDFTLQAGVPLLVARPSGAGLSLSVERFSSDDSGARGGSWHVPVLALAYPARAGDPPRRLMVASGAPTLAPDLPPGSLLNAGQTGYYRVLYEGGAFAAVRDRFAGLGTGDQLGILADISTLARFGRAPMAQYLSLVGRVPAGADPAVWKLVAADLRALGSEQAGLPSLPAFQAFARRLLGPVYSRVGFDPGPGEPVAVTNLRSAVVEALGELDDPAVAGEARRRFAELLRDPASLTGTARALVLQTVAVQADAETWARIHSLAQHAGSTTEKEEYYGLLAQAKDPLLARQALELALSDEAEVTLRPNFLEVASRRHPELAFDFGVSHWRELDQALADPDDRAAFIVGLAGRAHDQAEVDRVSAFAALRLSPSRQTLLRQTLSEIRDHERIRAGAVPQIARWISENPAEK